MTEIGKHREMESIADLELPTLGRTVRLFLRAVTLRCPNCGRGPVLKHWLKLRVRCGNCGIRLERGEHDYFLGSLLLNYILAGVLLVLVMGSILIASWPEVPWTWLEYGGPVAMLLAPVILFPFSKLIWLGFDITMRPVTAAELEWHRSAEREWSTDRKLSR